MADEPNTPDHRWYQRRYNISLAKEDVSRDTIYASGIAKIDAYIASLPGGSPITATVEPTAYAYSDGDAVNTHPSFATLDNTANYSSTAGTITSVEWLVDGTDQAGTYTLSAGQGVVIRVTDSAANTRDWTIDTSVDAVVPAQFNTNHWSLSNDGVNITLTVSTLPDDGGSALTDLEYKVNAGGYTSLGAATTGAYTITASQGDSVYLRAVNAVGNGPDSAAKTVPASGAALDLNFASGTYTDGTNTLLSDIATFSRSGNATMIDSTGTVVWAPHNLLPKSDNLDGWTLKYGVTTTANYANDQDGALLADRVVATSSFREVLENFTHEIGVEYTIKAFVKRTGGTNQTFRLRGNGGVIRSSDFTATDVWQEFTLTYTGTAAGARSVGISPDSANNDYDILVGAFWAYRSDLGGMADNPERSDSYVPTTTAAVYMPRENHYEYNGAGWVNTGLLLETDAATNLVTYSEAFDNAAYTKTAMTISANAATAPDGTLSADKAIPTTANVDHFLYTAISLSATTYTQSVWAKADGYNFLDLASFGNAVVKRAYFNLSTGSVVSTTNATALIEDFGAGWYRCSITFTPGAASHNVQFNVSDDGVDVSFSGDGTSGILLWGAQLEAGDYPSSYIPTAGATATRAAETLSVNAASTPWSTTAMSFVMEAEVDYTDNNATAEVQFFGNYVSASQALRVRLGTAGGNTGLLNALMENSGTIETADGPTGGQTTPAYRSTQKVGLRVTTTDLQAVHNGTSGTNETAVGGTLDSFSAENLEIGLLNAVPSGAFMGTIQRLRMWDSDIGASQLETETT